MSMFVQNLPLGIFIERTENNAIPNRYFQNRRYNFKRKVIIIFCLSGIYLLFNRLLCTCTVYNIYVKLFQHTIIHACICSRAGMFALSSGCLLWVVMFFNKCMFPSKKGNKSSNQKIIIILSFNSNCYL